MLVFHFIVWPGIPLNSSYCGFAYATHHLLINDPNYDMQQPPLTQIQHLCIFLRVGMIMLFIAFNPSKTKGEGEKEVFHRESITHTRTLYLQEYSKRAIYCKEDYGYLQIPCAGSQLIYSFCYSLLLHRKSTRCLSSGMQCSGQHLLLDLWQPIRVFLGRVYCQNIFISPKAPANNSHQPFDGKTRCSSPHCNPSCREVWCWMKLQGLVHFRDRDASDCFSYPVTGK